MCDKGEGMTEEFVELESPEILIAAMRLTKDLREAARLLSPEQQRYMVDLYYQAQEMRKGLANQARAASGEPNAWIPWMSQVVRRMEKLIAGALQTSTNEQAVSRWARAQVGIGPVLAAGLAAYIDITRTPSVSALWSLAGLNPAAVWSKGMKRPWNAQLKVLCWKIGDSFCKLHNHDDCLYGHVYAARKQQEVARNEAGQFREQAEKTLANRVIRDPRTRVRYEMGQLPDGRLELRARRVAVKLFLSHYWAVGYWEAHHTLPPKPYILAAQGELHTRYIPPPGYEEVFRYT
jgi:hypothetical protein